jgi:hypothetical protein
MFDAVYALQLLAIGDWQAVLFWRYGLHTIIGVCTVAWSIKLFAVRCSLFALKAAIASVDLGSFRLLWRGWLVKNEIIIGGGAWQLDTLFERAAFGRPCDQGVLTGW